MHNTKQGDRVAFGKADIFDWLYVEKGKVKGTIPLARCCWPSRKNTWTNIAKSTALSVLTARRLDAAKESPAEAGQSGERTGSRRKEERTDPKNGATFAIPRL
ncbi:DUF2314 domain-containing protein [Rhizobium mulingense]|uniref:DUF2314 domain-containing protein n=1 Tax=Rhizobium mulingense TaxID=3031128 RepID=A0ACC6N602_9HYPH|nr:MULTISPECIES: DUF2314 domain-containing protein [unclassified Rhizobium]MEA3520860.1 DUF2314 domain-containing protein [Rhizobium sp. MJ31]MEB3047705.1 DUF2314 domain-containing protein [Rhizobium sp. MJ21]